MINYEDYQSIKHLEENDKQSYELLQKISGDFLKTASAGCHDIRNHIASVSSYAQILALKQPEIMSTPAYQNLSSSISRLIALMDSINAYRYTYNTTNKSACDLKELINNAIQKTIIKFPDYKNSIIFTTDNSCREYTVNCCAEQMTLAICNVLDNAAEASIYEPRSISISLSPSGAFYEIKITDNGHGFSDEMLHDALTPFKTDKTHHFGLGLSTAANILYMHNGNLTISNTKHGATIAITIPA